MVSGVGEQSQHQDPLGILMLSKPSADRKPSLFGGYVFEAKRMDCLTQIGCIRDDCLVCEGSIRKLYVAKNGRPGATIKIKELLNPLPTEKGTNEGKKEKACEAETYQPNQEESEDDGQEIKLT